MKRKLLFSLLLLGTLVIAAGESLGQQKKTWTGSVSQDWSTPGNWNPPGVPTANDTAVINSGTCNLSADSTAAGLTLSAGTLTGSGSLVVTAVSTWSGGTMSLVGGLANAGTLTISGTSTKVLSNGAISNSGTIVHTNTGHLQFASGTLNNLTGSVYDFQSSGGFSNGGGTNSVSNAGTFRKSIYTGTTSIASGVVFNNNGGTFNVQSGTLSIAGGGSSTGGTYTVAANAAVDYTGGTQTFSGRQSGTGAGVVRISGGTLLISTSNADTLDFHGTLFEIAGGTVNALGILRNIGNVGWSGGTITGTGGFSNADTLTLSGTSTKILSNGTINNSGTILHTNTGFLQFASGTLNNLAGAIYDFQSSGGFSNGGGANAVNNNAGTFRKSIYTGMATIASGVVFNNNGGALDVLSGTLSIAGGGTSTGGTITVGLGAVLNPNGGGAYTYTGLHTGSGDGSIQLSAGTLTIGAGGATFNFSPGLFQWTAGTITGATLTNAGTLTISGTSTKVLSNGAISNSGTIVHTNTGHLQFASGTLNNLTGSVYDFQSSGGFSNGGGTNNVNNAGTFRKSIYTGTTSIASGVTFSNSGTVEVQSGTLSFSSYTQTAGTTILSTGTTLASTTMIDIQSGSLSGTGTVSANITNGGTVSPGASPGILTISGSYTQTTAGTLAIEIGGLNAGSQFDRLTVTGTAALNGALQVSLINGFVPSPADTLRIVNYGSNTGSFSTFNASNLFSTVYRPTGLTLVAGGIPTPIPPSNLVALANGTAAVLTWADNSSNEDGFAVERKMGVGGTWSQIATVQPNTTTYTNSGLTTNQVYYYRLRAFNGWGNSDYSNEYYATTLAGPSGLNAVVVSSSQINLSWTDNAVGETGFKIERKTGATGSWSEIGEVPGNSTSFANSGVSASTSYYFRVRAYASSTVATPHYSPYSNEASATTPAGVPLAPNNLIALATGRAVLVRWVDNSSNEQGFSLERKTGVTGAYSEIVRLGPDATGYSDLVPSTNQNYYYRVRSFNASGYSSYSTEYYAITMATPTGLTAIVVTGTQINLSWVDNTDRETAYSIEQKVGVGGTWSEIARVGANTSSYSNSGLTANATYYYRARAYANSTTLTPHYSDYSNEASATTSGASISLAKMWESGDYWKPRTYDGHATPTQACPLTDKYYAADFFYTSRNRPDIYQNGDAGTEGRPILAAVGGDLLIHMLDVTSESQGSGQFPLIDAVRVYQGLDLVPENCFSLVDAFGSRVYVDMSLIIDFNSNTYRTIFSHLQINSSYFTSAVEQKIRDGVKAFYNRTAIGSPPRVAISVGTTVSTGTQVGTINDWGIASQPHLHFQLFNGTGYSEGSPFLGCPVDLSDANAVTIDGQRILETTYEGTYGPRPDYQYPAMLRRTYGLNAPVVVNAAWDGGTGAKLRSNPGGNEITTLPNGNTGIIMQTTPQYQRLGSNNYLWYNVQFGSNVGWIAAEYIDPSVVTGPGWKKQDIATTVPLDGLFALNDQTASVSGDNGTMFRTANGGATWTRLAPAAELFLWQNFFVDSQVGWVAGSPSTGGGPTVILKTTDGGVTWVPQATFPDKFYPHGMYFHDVSTGRITTGGGYFLWTSDGGANWNEQPSPVSPMYEVKFADRSVGWASGSSGRVLKTTNGGVDWIVQETGTSSELHGLCVRSTQVVWASGSNATLVQTNNAGLTWNQIIVPEVPASSWIWDVYFANDNAGWIVGDDGFVARTTDGGSNWTPQDVPAEARVPLYRIRPSSPDVAWIVGDQGTVLRTANGGGLVSVQPMTSAMPSSLYLSQNYPNPFNPSTTIEFALPKSSFVTLRVYDLLGRQVGELVNEKLSPGTYKTQWSARGLASGVYFYRLTAGEYVETKKLLLLR